MSLVTCKQCKKQVARSAKVCPHCGVSNPAISTRDALIGAGVLAVIVAGVVAMCSDSDDDKRVAAEARAAADAECLKDLQCIGDRVSMTAGALCARDIEKLAKNNAKWTDGTLESKFSHFRWRDQKSGVVTFLGDKVQFQNGFGAYVNMTYECDIDVSKQSRVVLEVRARQGRLD